MSRKDPQTLVERSWIMYDWANSVYATIIMAAIFPIYFSALAPDGDVWWGYGTSVATFTVALLAPVLGAIADYKGMKKKLFTFFLLLGVVFTCTMAIFDNWKLLLAGYIISYIGFSGSCLFYDSFLTDVATPERMDSVSARGYAMGYIGGSTIPFLIAIALQFLIDTVLAIKISVVLTSVWWAVFSIPMLKNVSQTHSLGEIPKKLAADTLRHVLATAKDIYKNKSIFLFVLAYFFYIDGVNTVIHMSTAYGSTLGLGTVGMILALLVTQLVAAPCAVLFSRFSKKLGSIRMIAVAIGVYAVICAVGFYMGFSLEPSQMESEQRFFAAFDAAAEPYGDRFAALRAEGLSVLNSETRADDFAALAAQQEGAGPISDALLPVLEQITSEGEYDHALKRSNLLFWCMALLVGTCQGGIQALSRSYFGKLIPPERSNEYYGFFDIFGKFAAVLGPALYAFIKGLTGRSSYGILALLLLFVAGGVVLLIGRPHFAARGKDLPENTPQ